MPTATPKPASSAVDEGPGLLSWAEIRTVKYCWTLYNRTYSDHESHHENANDLDQELTLMIQTPRKHKLQQPRHIFMRIFGRDDDSLTSSK